LKQSKVNFEENQITEVVVEDRNVSKHCRHCRHALLKGNRQEVDAKEVGGTCTQQFKPSSKSDPLEGHSSIDNVLNDHQESA